MPSCPTFMGFAVAARDRRVCGGRDETELSVFHMPCKHRPLHVDFKYDSALWNGSRSFAGLQLWLIAAAACSRFTANPKRSRRASRLYGSK